MPRLATVGELPVIWNAGAGRYFAAAQDALSTIFDRMRPVPDPIIVTAGPGSKPGGDLPWEGNDPATGRRYVARKLKGADTVRLQEVTD
jgi:hypothetical protein